mmetsp:Transcript_22897/g.63556  ORF Transcript_22897/g.63556 Transcript_22897/m.63556 type:complete len:732 (+) Transcript_22897:153-2348(+)
MNWLPDGIVYQALALGLASLLSAVWKALYQQLIAAMGGSCSHMRQRLSGVLQARTHPQQRSIGSGGGLANFCASVTSFNSSRQLKIDEQQLAAARLRYGARSGLRSAREAVPKLMDICVDVLCISCESFTSAQVNIIPLDMVQIVFDRLVVRGKMTAELADFFQSFCLASIRLPGYPGVTDEWLVKLISSSLCTLDLSDCKLVQDTGVEGLSEAKNLLRVAMSNCPLLTDTGIQHIAGCANLQHLDLKGCDLLTGAALTYLSGLTSLQTLSLEMCHGVSCGIQNLRGMQRLQSLSLGWCNQLYDIDLCHLRHLTNLKSLNISRTKVTDGGLVSLLGLEKLDVLSLAGCPVTDSGVAALSSALTNLTSLNLEWCRVGDGCFPAVAANLPKLRTLIVAYSKVGDAALREIAKLGSLEDLNLDSCCNIRDQGAVSLRLLANLKSLDLSDTAVGNISLESFTALSNLTSLNLSYTNVTDAGMPYVRHLRALKYLNLDSRLITDAALPHLQCLPELESLDLFGAKVTDNGTVHLAALTSLQNLELCSGSITNKGMQHLSRIPNLRSLSVAQNPRISDGSLHHIVKMQHLEVSLKSLHPIPSSPSLLHEVYRLCRGIAKLGQSELRVNWHAVYMGSGKAGRDWRDSEGGISERGTVKQTLLLEAMHGSITWPFCWLPGRGLQALNLSHSDVSGQGLQLLADMALLETLALYGTTRVKPSAILKITEKLPQLTVLGVS